MSVRVDSVLDDWNGYVRIYCVPTDNDAHERGASAHVYVRHGSNMAGVPISANDARKLANALIEIAEADGA